jgi:predicted RNA-binding protein with PIN domain
MIYIIDANNLAGKMDLLKEKNFDKTLIGLISTYFFNHKVNAESRQGAPRVESALGQKNKVYLVFDSVDPFGDKYTKDNITIIYTPKNELYMTADEKIIELINKKLFEEKVSDEMTLITDDNGIIKEVLEMKDERGGRKIKFISAFDFAGRLMEDEEIESDETQDEEENRGLDSDTINKLNNNLLKIWK